MINNLEADKNNNNFIGTIKALLRWDYTSISFS